MSDTSIEILRSYDILRQDEAAMVVAKTTDVKSKAFCLAIEQIERAIKAGTIPTRQDSDCEIGRGNKDKAKLLRLKKAIMPAQTLVDEKQTMIQRDDLLRWMEDKDKRVKEHEPKIRKSPIESLDRRRETSLLCLIAAFATKLGYLPRDRSTAGKVKMMLENQGLSLSETKIRNFLDEASERKKEKSTAG